MNQSGGCWGKSQGVRDRVRKKDQGRGWVRWKGLLELYWRSNVLQSPLLRILSFRFSRWRVTSYPPTRLSRWYWLNKESIAIPFTRFSRWYSFKSHHLLSFSTEPLVLWMKCHQLPSYSSEPLVLSEVPSAIFLLVWAAGTLWRVRVTSYSWLLGQYHRYCTTIANLCSFGNKKSFENLLQLGKYTKGYNEIKAQIMQEIHRMELAEHDSPPKPGHRVRAKKRWPVFWLDFWLDFWHDLWLVTCHQNYAELDRIPFSNSME